MAFRLRDRSLRLGLAAALAASLVWVLFTQWLWTPAGLIRSIHLEPAFAGPVAHRDRVAGADLDFTSWPHGPRRSFSARWSGVWHVERAAAYDLFLGADDRAVLRLDGDVVLTRDASVGYSTVAAKRELSEGPHAIEIEYEQDGGRWFLNVGWAPRGGAATPLTAATAALFPTAPTTGQVRTNRRLRVGGHAVAGLWLFVIGAAIGVVAWRGTEDARRVARRAVHEDPAGWRGALAKAPRAAAKALPLTLARAARALPMALASASHALRPAAPWLTRGAVLAIVIVAAALRFEGIAMMYGPFEQPSWLFELEAHARPRIESLRPVNLHLGPVEQPYAGGDPINYLRFARAMTSFYAAHVREPVFPFATKVWLALLADQNVAVSFASAMFSTLAVLATYLLGSYAFWRWVGLGAALAFAIERDAIAWAAEGWRDDAMTCAFVAACYACLRCRRRPTVANAIIAGVIGGIACLTRITTLSFLLPAVALVGLAGGLPGAWRGGLPRGLMRRSVGGLAGGAEGRLGDPAATGPPEQRRHWRAAAIVLVVMAAVTAPYLINCAMVFGDPLYAINYHTVFYRARAGLTFDQPMDVGTYLATELRRDPWHLLSTFVQGMTTYPFGVKWIGFDYWWNGAGRVLQACAVVGLIGFLASSTGRVLLVLTACSLLPYAFTWEIPGGGEWRFTMHAYPIYLVAAALTIECVTAALWHRLSPSGFPRGQGTERFQPAVN